MSFRCILRVLSVVEFFECIVECFGVFGGILRCCECLCYILSVLSVLGESGCVQGLLGVFDCVWGVLGAFGCVGAIFCGDVGV